MAFLCILLAAAFVSPFAFKPFDHHACGLISTDCNYMEIYPQQYVAHKTSALSPESLDGDLSKSVWTEVPWTQAFIDISTQVSPKFKTRAKIRWDDNFLYIAAELEETSIWATLTEHNSVIFQDNDFEVFVDANATTHFYKEFEMNAFGTTWELQLNKPYNDGGFENSTRTHATNGWTMRTYTAVKVVPEDALNNPHVAGQSWSLEIALPFAKLVENTGAQSPEPGDFWRLGFSRVEYDVTVDDQGHYERKKSCQSCPTPGKEAEDNWVWTSQGEINMHAPERWGIVQFEDEKVGATQPACYHEWPSRSAAIAIYYAQKSYKKQHGHFAQNLDDLLPFSSNAFPVCPKADTSIVVTSVGQEDSWYATVESPAGPGVMATIRSDRHLTVSSL